MIDMQRFRCFEYRPVLSSGGGMIMDGGGKVKREGGGRIKSRREALSEIKT